MRADIAVRLASCLSAVSFGALLVWLHTGIAGGAFKGVESEAQTWVLAVGGPLGACGLTGIGYSILRNLTVNKVSYLLMLVFLLMIFIYWHGLWAILQDWHAGGQLMIEVMRKWSDKLIGLQCAVLSVLSVMFLQVSDMSSGTTSR